MKTGAKLFLVNINLMVLLAGNVKNGKIVSRMRKILITQMTFDTNIDQS